MFNAGFLWRRYPNPSELSGQYPAGGCSSYPSPFPFGMDDGVDSTTPSWQSPMEVMSSTQQLPDSVLMATFGNSGQSDRRRCGAAYRCRCDRC